MFGIQLTPGPLFKKPGDPLFIMIAVLLIDLLLRSQSVMVLISSLQFDTRWMDARTGITTVEGTTNFK